MKADKPDLKWLENPEVFEVNRFPAFSDHTFFYETPEDLTISLNGDWKVSVAENPAGRPVNFWKEDFDVSGWDVIQVPGELQMQGYGRNQYTNIIYPWDGIEAVQPPEVPMDHNLTASYVRTFDLPENYRNFEQMLTFHGVETAFYVWVNGRFVGYAEDSFTPSHFNITGFVREKDNRIAVEVYQRSTASWLEDQDMWRFTGIFRDVEISLLPCIHVLDLKTEQDINLAEKSAKLKVTLHNICKCNGNIKASLWYDGHQLEEIIQVAEKENVFDFEVRDVHLWSAEFPELYELKLEVSAHDSHVETVLQPVGFRDFRIEDGIMKLNGKRIQFHGINRHEFSAEDGRALKKDTMDFDARFMKRNNINAVRTSHYPNNSYWYQLADELGLYLIDEANMETHGTWTILDRTDAQRAVPGSNPIWTEAVLDRVRSMYERDKNHPSVLIWSLGNESYGGSNLVKMHDLLKELDPSRPVHYEGTTWCPQWADATDIESHMYAKPDNIRAYLENSPKKPFINCEYEHAMGNSLGNMQEYMDLEKYPHYQGGFIWDYVDQAIAVEENGKKVLKYGGDFGEHPHDGNFSGDGILFADRTETPKTPEMKQLYAFVDIRPTESGVMIQNNYLFDDLSDMEFVYEEKKDGNLICEGTFQVQTPPGEQIFVPIPWQGGSKPGIYTKTVTMKTAEDSPWARAGHELAFGQSMLVRHRPLKKDGEFEVVQGDGNVGVYGPDYSYYFSLQNGLISIVYDGQEMLAGPVKPDFFRAFTDNDNGAGYPQEAGIWMAATLFEKIRDVHVETNRDRFEICYTYALPFVNLDVYLTYSVYPSGLMIVTLGMDKPDHLPLLPCFGVRFCTPVEMDKVGWFGKGPQDTYADRDHARIDRYESTVAQQYVDYLRPQEHGNHMNTWWLRIMSENGNGIRFGAMNTPIQAGVTWYTPEELQLASHKEELPEPYECVVRILSDQMGVGGDDSWGAPVHWEYRIHQDQEFSLSFTVSKA